MGLFTRRPKRVIDEEGLIRWLSQNSWEARNAVSDLVIEQLSSRKLAKHDLLPTPGETHTLLWRNWLQRVPSQQRRQLGRMYMLLTRRFLSGEPIETGVIDDPGIGSWLASSAHTTAQAVRSELRPISAAECQQHYEALSPAAQAKIRAAYNNIEQP